MCIENRIIDISSIIITIVLLGMSTNVKWWVEEQKDSGQKCYNLEPPFKQHD